MGVFGGDVSVVDSYGATGDGEAEADSSGGFVSGGVGSEVGVEDAGEEVFGDTWAVVADGDFDLAFVAVEVDFHGGIGGRIADRVAGHILKSAVEEFGVAPHGDGG